MLLEKFGEQLSTITDEELNKQATSLSQKLLEKNKNLGQEVRGVWSKISAGYYDFKQEARDAAAVLELTKEDIKKFYDEFISIDAAGRRKMSVHMTSQKVGVVEESDQTRYTIIKEEGLLEFKAKLALGNSASPVLTLADYFDYRLIASVKL